MHAPLKQGVTLDDHLANRTWEIIEPNPDHGFILKVVVHSKIYRILQESKRITYSFDIITEGDQLKIFEREGSGNLLSYTGRTDTKTRTEMSLYRVGQACEKSLSPLCGLTTDELFEPTRCGFSPRVSFNRKEHKHFGVSRISLKDLVGEWKIVGIGDFPKKKQKIMPFTANEELIIRGDHVLINGDEYKSELKYHYNLSDVHYKDKGTCLHLVPTNKFLRPVTLAIYSSGKNLLLATQRVSSHNSVTGEARTLYQSLFYAR